MIGKFFNYTSEFFNAVFGKESDAMTPEQETYNRIVAERQAMIESTTNNILKDIERVCRTQDEVTITQYGFDNVSSILYEDSMYEKIVNCLESLGYRCTMSFDYTGGKLSSSLKVAW